MILRSVDPGIRVIVIDAKWFSSCLLFLSLSLSLSLSLNVLYMHTIQSLHRVSTPNFIAKSISPRPGNPGSATDLMGIACSVGSLGRYAYEKDVNGLVVTGCNLTNTLNGVRIKSWQASPVTISARNITFDHIIVENVANPIIIDQKYCPIKTSCDDSEPSRVKLSDITFSNIMGTSTSPVAVNLQCSAGFPCEGIKLQNINITYIGDEGATTSACAHVNPSYSGLLVPVPCVIKS